MLNKLLFTRTIISCQKQNKIKNRFIIFHNVKKNFKKQPENIFHITLLTIGLQLVILPFYHIIVNNIYIGVMMKIELNFLI